MAKEEKNEEVVENVEEAVVENEAEVSNAEVETSGDEIVIHEELNPIDTKGINVSEEVVAKIASIAASEVKGVVAMKGNGLGELFGGKPKGVKVQMGDKETIIDINITVEYGSRIPDVAWEVQNNVKTQVEMMTGLTIASVNINVQGISMQKKTQEQKPELEEADTGKEPEQ